MKNPNDVYNLPTVASTVTFAKIGNDNRPIDDSIGTIVTHVVSTGLELVRLGCEMVSQQTGVTMEEIKSQSSGPKVILTDDGQYVKGFLLEVNGVEWAFICVEPEFGGDAIKTLFN